MISLAIESSGRAGSVALCDDAALLDERTFPHSLRHAAALVPLIDSMLRDRSISPKQVEVIHVGVGPGSFTGLRVGVTLAKTFSFATGAKLTAVPTLDTIVENLDPTPHTQAIALLDAKRGQVFAARFERTANSFRNWRAIEPARLDTATGMISRASKDVIVTGEGIDFHFAAIESAGVAIAAKELWQPRAAVVAKLGRERAANNDFVDAFALRPIYVRLPEAEEKRLIAEGKLHADGTPMG